MNRPERSCVICKKVMEKQDLLRIVKSKEGDISFDLTGKKNGRGAYICGDLDCSANLKKLKALDRSFKMKISDEIYDKILEEVNRMRKGKNG